jgi:shikimate kinase
MDNYWRIVKKAGGMIVVLKDKPENILQRITFYDIDSRPIEKHLTKKEKLLYLKEIKKDITYFRRTYARADLTVDITGLGPDESAKKIKHALGAILQMKADTEKQRAEPVI